MGKKKPAKRKGKKRRSKKLTDKQLRQNIENVCRGKVSDEPADAWIQAPRMIQED